MKYLAPVLHEDLDGFLADLRPDAAIGGVDRGFVRVASVWKSDPRVGRLYQLYFLASYRVTNTGEIVCLRLDCGSGIHQEPLLKRQEAAIEVLAECLESIGIAKRDGVYYTEILTDLGGRAK